MNLLGQVSQVRRIYTKLLVVILAAILLVVAYVGLIQWPLYAAIEIEYFNAITVDDHLRLEWRTVVENDLAAIEVYCKEEAEPLSAYHLVDTRLAQGNKDQGAHYQMDLYAGIEPGVSYCFRLKEITTDGRKGDILDYCGYGLNIQPIDSQEDYEITPTAIITTALPFTLTPIALPTLLPTMTTIITESTTQTVTIITSTTVITEVATPIVTPLPSSIIVTGTATATDTPETITIINTPISAPTPVNTEQSPDEDGIVVIPTEVGTTDTLTTIVPIDSEESLTAQSTPTPEEQFTIEVSATETPSATGTITSTGTLTITDDELQGLPTATATATVRSQSATSDADSSTSMSQATNAQIDDTTVPMPENLAGNPPYIILTATPNIPPIALQPTFTAFPTAAIQIAENGTLLAAFPTQNLMILLLCGVFSGASGLGILGIVTTLLYMRSRSSD